MHLALFDRVKNIFKEETQITPLLHEGINQDTAQFCGTFGCHTENDDINQYLHVITS